MLSRFYELSDARPPYVCISFESVFLVGGGWSRGREVDLVTWRVLGGDLAAVQRTAKP